MSDATFQTFMVTGLMVLIAAIVYLAWSAWRWVDRERDMEKLALTGIGHEMRLNLKRMISELAGIADGRIQSEVDVIPVVYPQLDGLLSRPNEADRRGLTQMRGNYNELSAHKQSLRLALAGQGDVSAPANAAVNAVIGSIATLYLWEEHKGCPPDAAHSTRSWHVRDWMKAHGFDARMLPGLHLRDAVVEYLRTHGMTLTPKPLTHTASEYYAMQYDRKADPNAPFWKRKAKPAPEPEAEVEEDIKALPEEVAEMSEELPVEVEPEMVEEPVAAAEPDTVMQDEGEAFEPVEVEVSPDSDPVTEAEFEADTVETVEADADPLTEPKPQTPGAVY